MKKTISTIALRISLIMCLTMAAGMFASCPPPPQPPTASEKCKTKCDTNAKLCSDRCARMITHYTDDTLFQCHDDCNKEAARCMKDCDRLK